MPDGIPVRATMSVDPDEGLIHIDLTDNIDNLPLGINLTEATVTAACRVAVLTALGPDVPRATGRSSALNLNCGKAARWASRNSPPPPPPPPPACAMC